MPVVADHKFSRQLVQVDSYNPSSFRTIITIQRHSQWRRPNLYGDSLPNQVWSLGRAQEFPLTVYGISYTISYNYLAYAHLRIAKWLTEMRADHRREEIIAHVKEFCNDSNSAVLHDAMVHFRKAKVNYEKAIQLHTAGLQFKNAIKNLVYLEDDINDNAFHFGAAMERWLYNNGILEDCIKQCEKGELADLQKLKA
jgi:hypothetical protein